MQRKQYTIFFFLPENIRYYPSEITQISSKTYFLNRKYLVLKHCVVYSNGVKSTLLYVKPSFITFLIRLKSAVSNSNLIKFYFSMMLSQCLI